MTVLALVTSTSAAPAPAPTTATTTTLSSSSQWVEGFERIEFHHNAGGGGGAGTRDFRGTARGYMTAGWWAPGQVKDNYVSWQTAVVPEKAKTTFVFIAATSPLPSEMSRGPEARLFVNGHEALTFTLGIAADRTWNVGEYELKYISKRVEFPYFGQHRQLRDLHGNSGIYHLTIPAAAVEAGKPAVIKVEILPLERWPSAWFMVKHRRDVLERSMETLAGEIDALRQDMATVNQQTHTLATQIYRDLLGDADERFEHEVIYRDGFRHLHPADLIALKNGELLLLTREGTEHISVDGDVILVRSKDGGKTWGKKETVSAIKDLDEREGCGVQLDDGTIVVGIFYNNLYGPDGAYKSGHAKILGDGGRRHLGAFIVTSSDDGRTWSQPNYIDTKAMPFANLEGPTDAPLKMPDGSILMGVIGYAPRGEAGNRAAVMLRSTDKGRSWTYLATMADDPGGKLGGFMEPGICRTKGGRIVAGLRNHGPDNAVWVTWSDDDGRTWSPVKKTGMIGHPVDLVQLRDGRLMATYGVRTEHGRPQGVRACFSSDNGETWDVKNEVQIRKDFTNWDIGYPESIELPDGRVLSVYYYNLFGKYFIGGTFWNPAP